MVDTTKELFEIHDRMPIILHPDEQDARLNCPAEGAIALLRKYSASGLVVDRTAKPWFKRRAAPSEGPTLI